MTDQPNLFDVNEPKQKHREPLAKVIEQFREDANRWLADPKDELAGTLAIGRVKKASMELNLILEAAAVIAIAIAGEAATEKVSRVCNGKQLSRLTMGEHAGLLSALKGDLSKVLVEGQAVLIPKEQKELLDSLVRRRNEFEHGKLPWAFGTKEFVEEIQRYLADGLRLVDGELFKRLADYEVYSA